MTKTKGNNAGKAVAVVLALAVLGGGVTACGYASRNDAGEWYKNPDFSTWHWADNKPADDEQNGGNVNTPGENNATVVGGSSISEIQNNGVNVLKAALPRAAFAAMGVSEQAETAYTLTAEVSPSYASDKSLDWSNLAFLDSESEWATGKTVTDYVTVTPSADGNSAVLACLQDFGEPIVLTVSSVSNPEVFATCNIDYYQRVKSCEFAFFYDGAEITPTINNGVYKIDYTGAEKDYTVELRPVYSNYTLTDTYTTTTSGAFSSAFGYTTTAPLNSLAIAAGMTDGEPFEATLDMKTYASFVMQYCNFGPNYRPYSEVTAKYNQLSEEEKQHPYTVHYLALFNAGKKFTDEDGYTPSVYHYYGAEIPTYNDFVLAVKACNNSGVGVIQYTVNISGTHSNFTTVLNLGYNDEFKLNVQDVTLSDNNVAF